MKTLLSACLCLAFSVFVIPARAIDILGDLAVSAPYIRTDKVNVTGNLTFNTPGVYSAQDWNVLGNIRFAAAGAYTFTATAGAIRAIGNVTGPAAAAPSLAVFNGAGAQIGANAGWPATLAGVFRGVGAFALADGSADSAVLLTLAPGNYTARIAGAGEVLAEIYFVD